LHPSLLVLFDEFQGRSHHLSREDVRLQGRPVISFVLKLTE
jgi:hypothetical protein